MKNNMRMKTFLRRYAEIIVAYCVLAVVLVLFAFNQADFFTLYGPQSIFNQVITLCVASLGQTVIILTSGIDLSVGNLIIFSNCVAATIYMPVTNMLGGSILLGGIATVVIVLLIGVLTGLFNGCGLRPPSAHRGHAGHRLYLQRPGPLCPAYARRRCTQRICTLLHRPRRRCDPHVCHHSGPGHCVHLGPLPPQPIRSGALCHRRK